WASSLDAVDEADWSVAGGVEEGSASPRIFIGLPSERVIAAPMTPTAMTKRLILRSHDELLGSSYISVRLDMKTGSGWSDDEKSCLTGTGYAPHSGPCTRSKTDPPPVLKGILVLLGPSCRQRCPHFAAVRSTRRQSPILIMGLKCFARLGSFRAS